MCDLIYEDYEENMKKSIESNEKQRLFVKE